MTEDDEPHIAGVAGEIGLNWHGNKTPRRACSTEKWIMKENRRSTSYQGSAEI